MLTPDVRFEGWTTEDWVRFLGLWKPRGQREENPPERRRRGGLFVVHEDGHVLKILHTTRGRIDPAARGDRDADEHGHATALREGRPSPLAALALAHGASWAVGLRLGALDELMERFGARARRGDDITAQLLSLIGVVRELMDEGAIASWPQRLQGVPVPSTQVVERALDAICPDGKTLLLGLFDDAGLWTSFAARRRGAGFDVIAGPDELRPALGLLSGDWRRDYRHLARAVEDRYGPLGFGCFAEVDRFRALQTDPAAGAWGRAVAVRDVVVAPMPVAVGVGLGVDGVRYALRGVRLLAGRIAPLAALGPAVDAARAGLAKATGKDIAALLGFDPLAVLRTLLER